MLKYFKTDFSLARPIWESGNTRYNDWYDSSKEDKNHNIKPSDLAAGDAFYWNLGSNESRFAWIDLNLGGSSYENNLYMTDKLANTVISVFPLDGIKDMVTGLKTGNSTDYRPEKYGAVGETGITLKTGTQLPFSYDEAFSEIFPTKTNGYYNKRKTSKNK